MNVLANYASESDSDEDAHPKQSAARQPSQVDNDQDRDNDFVLSALKDLQSFAASVESQLSGQGQDSIRNPTQNPAKANEASITEKSSSDVDDHFRSFLDEINAIPYRPEELPQPPPPPPVSPPPDQHLSIPPPPPPPLSPPLELLTECIVDIGSDGVESAARSIETIYSRLDHLSLLPSTSIDEKNLRRHLLEFAIRIVDWKKGGLEEAYFLGKERAVAMANLQQSATDGQVSLPPFGGIVGSAIKHMYELERTVAPPGWSCVWDAEDEAYGFQHSKTGTYSSVYPSLELLNYLDPPAVTLSSISSTSRNNGSRSYYTSRPSLVSPTTVTASPTLHSPQCQGSSSSSQSSVPEGSTFSITPLMTSITKSIPATASTYTTATKKKKRKPEDGPQSLDSNPFTDQHIHPSRRAVLTSNTSTQSSLSVSSGSSSKVMPKKLANLFQKWNEKDMEMSSDEEERDEEKEARSRHPPSSAITGANTQSLGGDWRDRRLHK